MDTPTKPLQKLEKKDMVAQIANIKSTNCFLQTNLPNITLANKYSCMVLNILYFQKGNLAKFGSSNISETGEAMPIKISVHGCDINLYLHKFFELILINSIF